MNSQNFEFPIWAIAREEYNSVNEWIDNNCDQTIRENGLFIYGAGIRGSMMRILLEKRNIKINGFIDGSDQKIGCIVGQYTISSLEEVLRISDKTVKILVSPENYHDIDKRLSDKGLEQGKDYWVIDNRIYDRYIEDFFFAKNVRYLALGDCFFTDLDSEELDSLTLGETLTEKIGGTDSVRVLSLHGMCIPGFYHLMKAQLQIGGAPEAVAFIVNVPFCNSIQTKLPQSQHYELFKMLKDKLPETTKEFDEYVEVTNKRSKNINASSFSTKNKGDSEHIEKMLTKTRYMYEFKEDNENIIYMRKMIELLLKNNIRPVPFIPALNYFIAEEWFGEEFMIKYRLICDGIKRIVNEYDIELLDMSLLLEENCYCGRHMTKFPNKMGMEKEAQRLKEALIGK